MSELTGERARQAAQKFEDAAESLEGQIEAAMDAGNHDMANRLISKQNDKRQRAEELRENV